VTITSPAQNAALPAGPVTSSFTVQNFTIGGMGESHLQFHVNDDPIPYDFLNGTTNQVHYAGAPAANVEWQNSNGMRLANLANGAHQIQFTLVDAAGAELTNPEAMTLLVFSVGVPRTVSRHGIVSPRRVPPFHQGLCVSLGDVQFYDRTARSAPYPFLLGHRPDPA
jgi:hypothetical protein